MGVLIAVSCCLRLSEKPIGIITEYRSMVVARTSAKFVDLIDEDKGIAGSCRLQALHHLARHGPHIGPPMTWTLQCKYVSASNEFSSMEQQKILLEVVPELPKLHLHQSASGQGTSGCLISKSMSSRFMSLS